MINGTLMSQGKVDDIAGLDTSVVVSDSSGAVEVCGQTGLCSSLGLL